MMKRRRHSPPSNDWQHNISTGSHLLDDGNKRIVRWGTSNSGYLYKAEFWGDYSRKYPIKGPWRESLKAARSDLNKMEHQSR